MSDNNSRSATYEHSSGDALKRTKARALELFAAHLRDVHVKTDRTFAILLGVEWLVGSLFACLISPRAWAGRESSVHPHVLAAIFLGGVLVSLPIGLAWRFPGLTVTRHVIAFSQMLMSALLIHLTGGRIETHFHVFGSLAFLGFYRDWKVLLTATLTVAIDHLLRGIFYPESVYGVLSATIWRTLEHAGWVLFEVFFLVQASLNSLKEMTAIAERQANMEEFNRELQESHAHLEESIGLLNSSNASLDVKNTELSEANYQLDNAHDQLRPALHHLLGVNRMLQATVERLRQLVNQQNASVEQRSDNLTKAAAHIAEFRRKQGVGSMQQMLRDATDSASRTEEFSQASQGAIAKNLAGLEAIRVQMESIRITVDELAERTRKIGSITERVEDFADQSNLLALNATIEAARAGEAGRGFGVVAQEIRGLADRSLQSTEEIRRTLTDIESAIGKAHEITTGGNERVEGELAAIRSSAENLGNISDLVRRTGNAVSTIAGSVDEQNTTLQQVSEIVDALEIASGETQRSAADLTSTASELNTIAERIQEAMDLIQGVEKGIVGRSNPPYAPREHELSPVA